MKTILLALTLICITSFSFLSPRKKTGYTSPDLNKLMVYVPSMSFNYREADTLLINDALVFTNTYSMKGFYMFPYEVSNGQYVAFINDLKLANDSIWKISMPDTMVWREKMAYNDAYTEWYLRHPAYANYPVVGITQKQCILFCDWLTKKYNNNPERKYKKVKFRLPTKYEWYAAAVYKKQVNNKEKKHIGIYDDNLFPWNGSYLRNKEGICRANYKMMDETSIHREFDTITAVYGEKIIRQKYVCEPGIYMGIAGSLNDAADITAPVNSYWPNDLGIYNMAGNVEEFVSEYGITKGGSWRDPGYYLRNTVIETYQTKNEATSSRGFRFVMEVLEN
jgi:sulfatase modifying factor 1